MDKVVTVLPDRCIKCGSRMEKGFILEHRDGGITSSETWVSGEPVDSLLAGLNLRGRAIHNVVSFRCDACGYLESYALPKQ